MSAGRQMRVILQLLVYIKGRGGGGGGGGAFFNWGGGGKKRGGNFKTGTKKIVSADISTDCWQMPRLSRFSSGFKKYIRNVKGIGYH